MDNVSYFEVTETPIQIIEADEAARIDKNITTMYTESGIALYERIDKDPEARYIYNKFPHPLSTNWFLGKYTSEALFIPERITNRAGHTFLTANILQSKHTYDEWIIKAIRSKNGFSPNWIITEYSTDSTEFQHLENPIVTKNSLIQEGNTPRQIKKFDYIHCGALPSILKEEKFADESIISLSNMYILKTILLKYLNINGIALFTTFSFSAIFKEDYHFPFILKLCFEKVFVSRTKITMCVGFKGVPKEVLAISRYGLTNADIRPLRRYVLYSIKELSVKWRTYLGEGDYINYFKLLHKVYLENKKLLNLSIDVIDNDANLFSIRKVQKNPKNISKYLNAGINEEEGTFLYNLILKYSCKKVVEVGMANGISASYITSALKKQEAGMLISIDPFQSTQWRSSGLELLRDIQTKSYHKLIEKKSLEALPELLKRNSSTVDLVFVDGWHTFDYTLVDIFFAVFLLKVGGILVIDDALHPGVENTLKYLDTNYTMLRRIKSPRSFGAYEKFQDDTRDWNFHKKF